MRIELSNFEGHDAHSRVSARRSDLIQTRDCLVRAVRLDREFNSFRAISTEGLYGTASGTIMNEPNLGRGESDQPFSFEFKSTLNAIDCLRTVMDVLRTDLQALDCSFLDHCASGLERALTRDFTLGLE